MSINTNAVPMTALSRNNNHTPVGAMRVNMTSRELLPKFDRNTITYTPPPQAPLIPVARKIDAEIIENPSRTKENRNKAGLVAILDSFNGNKTGQYMDNNGNIYNETKSLFFKKYISETAPTRKVLKGIMRFK